MAPRYPAGCSLRAVFDRLVDLQCALDLFRKFEGLFGSIGYDRTVDCTTESADAILARIAAAYEDRATLAREAAAALQRGRDKLGHYETALRALMARAGG